MIIQIIKNCKLFFLVFLFMGIFHVSVKAHEHMDNEWEPVSPGPFNTWTAPLCGKESFIIQTLMFYNNITGSLNEKGKFIHLDDGTKKTQYNIQLFLQYGLFEYLETDIQLSFINNNLKQTDNSINVSGFGDMLLMVRYCPFEETTYIPHITGLFQIKLPTGKYKEGDENKLGLDLFGTGSTDFTFGLNLSKKLKPLIFHSDLLYTIPTEVNIDSNKIQYGNSINFNLATEVVLPYGFSLMIEFNGLTQENRKENNLQIDNSEIESGILGFGVGYSTEKVQFLLGYLKTIYGKNTDYIDTIAFTLIYPILN